MIKARILHYAILSIIIIVISNVTYAQEVTQDSTVSVEPSSNKENRGFLDIFEGKPGKAALYSLMLPGAGQAYNRRYWKIPFALGVEGFFIYRIIDKRRSFKALDQKWRASLVDFTSLDCPDSRYTSSNEIKTDRDRVRQELEYAWVFWGLSHIVVTLEAFVDRHLIDFDIDEDLSLKFKPESYITSPILSGSFPAISLSYTLD